jgi:hypothetical protein
MSPVFFSSVFNGRYYVTCLFFLVFSMEDIMSPVFFFQCLPWKILCHLSFFSSVFHRIYYVTCRCHNIFHGRHWKKRQVTWYLLWKTLEKKDRWHNKFHGRHWENNTGDISSMHIIDVNPSFGSSEPHKRSVWLWKTLKINVLIK